MMIYVRCITYGYKGKYDHLFTEVKATETLGSFKEKVMKHFKVDDNIDMFDDSTEQLLDSYDCSLKECLTPMMGGYSITFGSCEKNNEAAYYL